MCSVQLQCAVCSEHFTVNSLFDVIGCILRSKLSGVFSTYNVLIVLPKMIVLILLSAYVYFVSIVFMC